MIWLFSDLTEINLNDSNYESIGKVRESNSAFEREYLRIAIILNFFHSKYIVKYKHCQ